MCKEMDALMRNQTCDLVQLPSDRKALRNKWLWRAVYYQPAWRRTSQPTFTFLITNATDSSFGDGLAFFVAAAGARLNLNSTGGWLGLTDCATDANSSNQIVVVEFDTWQNEWDPPSDHIGIDVNSVRSVVNKTLPDQSALRRGSKSETWVEYQGMRLSVFLSSNGLRGATPDMYYNIDLRQYFPEWVTVGFAASTGDSTELHSLLSWEFSISDPPPAKKLTHRRAIFAAAIIIPVLTIVVLCAVLYRRWYYSQLQVDLDIDVEIHRWLVYGPRRFRHKELCLATRGFAEKLGHGGFGGVYYGTLPGLMLRWPSSVSPEVPNRFPPTGKKEYISEISIISQLRHQNLVRLLGWCHEGLELLLVYEHMPNRSLDQHLYGEILLQWALRYKIACGLACALFYLHEEWQQRILHRDVKASNVMLDAQFNAKLGDFRFARLVEHGGPGSTSTVIAGTMGYLAPECLMTGRASAESDVFSFGAVAFEIVCGRRPVFVDNENERIRLVEWVWNLYGKGRLMDGWEIF
ncbi:L-type lectin-domain containing receptor kinase IX.1-like [Cryptomeria japonica]|uniref:L-type lectin-domain containing receptor kinase IX.1-like n=1 Tax=Cryptomeria japonica TaxID=3369 RepID=UPI0027D9ECC2|nr:L-type lectin-domain containing receptor kinase IX.1-like [Cryptomeria japonica]